MLEQLKDIRSIETIQVDFLPYFLAITFCILLFVIVLFLFTRKKKKKPTKQQIAKQKLKSLDFNSLQDKQLAYQFSEYGYICVEEHYKDEFIKIVNQLEAFKYKKEVGKIDNDLKEQMKDYIKVRI